MKILKLIIPILLLSSCAAYKQKICSTCPTVTEVVTKETIKITPFDTALFISQRGKDLEFNSDANDCCILVNELMEQMAAGNGTITAKENGIKSSIFKVNNKVVFRCAADSLEAVIKGLRTTIEKTTDKSETKTIQLPCDKDHVKWYHRYALNWFWITVALLLGYFAPKLLKLLKFF